MKNNTSRNLKAVLIGLITTIIVILIFGIPTALIKNPWFKRMIPATSFDYVFLFLNSTLFGVYLGLHYYEKYEENKKGDMLTAGGVITNIFAVGCPICNVLLVSLFGANTLLLYFEPYRPLVGLLSTTILSMAIYWQFKNKCIKCTKH